MDLLSIAGGLAAALLWGVSDYLVAFPARKIGQYRTVAYAALFGSLILLPAAYFAGINTNISYMVLFLAVLSSVSLFLGFIFADTAFRYGDVAIAAPIVNSYPAITVIGAVLLLNDSLSVMQFLAIASVILGIILISMKFSALKKGKKILAIGVESAIASMFFLGIVGIFTGAYVGIIGYALLCLMWRGISSILGFASVKALGQDMRPPSNSKVLMYLIGAGVTDALAVLIVVFAIAVHTANLPTISTLAGFAGGVTVLLAFMFLKERPEGNQWLGIVLAIIGIVALSFFS